jgi:hypothetical protein
MKNNKYKVLAIYKSDNRNCPFCQIALLVLVSNLQFFMGLIKRELIKITK